MPILRFSRLPRCGPVSEYEHRLIRTCPIPIFWRTAPGSSPGKEAGLRTNITQGERHVRPRQVEVCCHIRGIARSETAHPRGHTRRRIRIHVGHTAAEGGPGSRRTPRHGHPGPGRQRGGLLARPAYRGGRPGPGPDLPRPGRRNYHRADRPCGQRDDPRGRLPDRPAQRRADLEVLPDGGLHVAPRRRDPGAAAGDGPGFQHAGRLGYVRGARRTHALHRPGRWHSPRSIRNGWVRGTATPRVSRATTKGA